MILVPADLLTTRKESRSEVDILTAMTCLQLAVFSSSYDPLL